MRRRRTCLGKVMLRDDFRLQIGLHIQFDLRRLGTRTNLEANHP